MIFWHRVATANSGAILRGPQELRVDTTLPKSCYKKLGSFVECLIGVKINVGLFYSAFSGIKKIQLNQCLNRLARYLLNMLVLVSTTSESKS